MSDQSDSAGYPWDRPSLLDVIAELMNAGSRLCDLVGIEWSSVPDAERLEAAQQWQRAVLHLATYQQTTEGN